MPQYPELFALVSPLVEQGIDYIKNLIAKGSSITRHYNWPVLSWLDNGLPSLRETMIDGPPDYGATLIGTGSAWLLGLGGESVKEEPFDLIERPAFKSLVTYIESHPSLPKYLLVRRDGISNYWKCVPTTEFVRSLVDRYLHTYPDMNYSQERLLEIYRPLEIGQTEDSLPVEVAVPILFLAFEDQSETALQDDAAVFRMEDDFHLARADKRAYGPGVHDTVMGAATHALILRGYALPNEQWVIGDSVSSKVNAYPLQKIETFFAALRIVTGLDTGYAQLLLVPNGWVRSYNAHLPHLDGTSIRRYPDWFEDFYWLKPRRVVTAQQLQTVGQLFHRLSEAFATRSGSRLLLACQRLNSCFLRGDEQDAILDATIALEILLCVDDHQEITHKLATRLAALSTLAKHGEHTPAQVFANVKTIYALRSAVAHGDARRITKAREIRISEKERIPTLDMAIKYVRMVISVMAEHLEYMVPSVIDEQLLLASLVEGREGDVK